MQFYVLILFCAVITGWYGTSSAEIVGSTRPEVQKNFQALIKTNSCPDCDLAGVVLTRVNLAGANLEGANLAGAKLNLANLSKANLKNANLQGAGLGGVDFSGADLRGANLTGAVLGGAYFKDALLDGQIVSEQPYQAQGLPDVAETTYQPAPTESKAVPYTQELRHEQATDPETVSPAREEAVIASETSAEPALSLAEETVAEQLRPEPVSPQVTAPAVAALPVSDEAVDQPVTPAEQVILQEAVSAIEVEPTAGYTPEKSKTLTPMADAVVDDSISAPAMVEEKGAAPAVEVVVEKEAAPPVAEEPGFWASVGSFFSSDPKESKVEEKQVAAEPVEEIVISKKEEILVNQPVEPVPEPVTEAVAAAKIDIAAVENQPPAEELVVSTTVEVVEEPSTAPGQETAPAPLVEEEEQPAVVNEIALSAFPEDTAAQEKPPVEAATPEPAEQLPAPGQETAQEEKAEASGFWNSITSVFTSSDEKEDENSSQPAAVSDAADQSAPVAAEEPDSPELPADASVSSMIEQIEATPEPAPAPGEMVYTVLTPQQAQAEQQMLVEKLLDMNSCVACELPGIDLSGKNLDKLDLERANLQGANLEGIDLKKANLKGTDFSGANLKNADLRKADLYRADFTGADLTGAKFEGALVDSTDFTNATGLNLEGAVKEE
jgi:uncharacterized protein YjbI with pentapeptide repeats